MAELTVPRVDFSSLGELPDIYRNARTQAVREQTLAQLGQGGGPINYSDAAQKLFAAGLTKEGMSLAQLGNSQRDYDRSIANDARSQANADRSFGLQERQLAAANAERAAARDFQRQQFAWQQEQGNRPEVQMVEDENGRKIPVLIDRKTMAARPINTGGIFGASTPSNIPPGVDAATYRKKLAEDAVKEATAARDLQRGGATVMGMVNQLERKIYNPNDPSVAKRFGAAAGPYAGPGSDAATWDPRRAIYEGWQSRESKAYLDQIKQDAQAINSTMQRTLLKGQGAVSDSERAQIAQILGQITQARSPEDALAALNNFRGIVRRMFQMPEQQGQAASPAAPAQTAPTNTPAPPPGFQLVK